MRFSVTYDVAGSLELPIDYRAAFVSLIKNALENANYPKYSKGVVEHVPICFAVRFDRKPEIIGDKIVIGKNIRLYISSPSHVLGTAVYNGLLSINEFPIYHTRIANPIISYVKEYDFRRDLAVFVTLSPIVIRHFQKKDRYVLPNEEGFSQSFNNALEEQWATYNSGNLGLHGSVKVGLLKFKKVVMTHYGGLVLGFTGIIQFNAEPSILKFFYQSGIGYRRTNGFGFVEVDQ
jgi:CRISPR-associated endoribonuclease Cas6